ncbi:hypothetical protein [Flavobacterium piscis]|uniref:Uncharacterized protein n=1 Tax=Flavobacterium piscis TaxID=1114874 RepID=A0ABU1YDI3_9FLAO|nr:hypothetical protein [Flavobacterium piscis]MDR7211471.1 hypothetical protein [Flavobacterium piscis]
MKKINPLLIFNVLIFMFIGLGLSLICFFIQIKMGWVGFVSIPPETSLYSIIDNYYTFTNYVHPNIPEAYSGKIWINASTGEVKIRNEGLYLKAYHSYKW